MDLRKVVKRAVGLRKIQELKRAAKDSIGIREGSKMAKLELRTSLEKYELVIERFEELDSDIEVLLEKIPGVPQMLAITGIGKDTVAGFLSEVGDLRNYSHPRQIIKLAGLNLKESWTPIMRIYPGYYPKVIVVLLKRNFTVIGILLMIIYF